VSFNEISSEDLSGSYSDNNVFDLMRNMNSTEECADQSKSKSGGENFPED
jgi:hypothetical protein